VTVLDLVTKAAQELNIFDAGTPLDNADAVYIFDLANDFLDGLKTQGLSVSTVTRQTFTLTGAASYAVGLGSAVNVDRPVSPDAILNVGYVYTNTTPNTEILNGPPITTAVWAAIPQKTLTGTYPVQWYYEATSPTGTLRPFPIPPSGTGVIYVPTLLAEFTSLAQTITLLPGARRFLRTNLALEIADAYEVEPSQGLREKARQSRADYYRVNQRLDDMSTWPGGWYDINSDTYR